MSEKKRSSYYRHRKMAKKNIILASVIVIITIVIVVTVVFLFKCNGEKSKPSSDVEKMETKNVSIEMEQIDKTWLKKAIKSADAVEKNNYTEETYSKMYENLKAAKKIHRKIFPDQQELNEAFVNLVQSIEKLEPINS